MSHIFLVLLYWLILYCKKRKEKQFCIVLWTFDLMDILNYIPSKSINIFSFSRQFLVWLSEKFCLLGISSFSCFNISQPVPMCTWFRNQPETWMKFMHRIWATSCSSLCFLEVLPPSLLRDCCYCNLCLLILQTRKTVGFLLEFQWSHPVVTVGCF